jgi:hypothetical protein
VGWSTKETFSMNVSNIYKSNRNVLFELSNIYFFEKNVDKSSKGY